MKRKIIKFLAALTAFILVLSLSACGNSHKEGSKNDLLGTWVQESSDTTIDYIIFDENGYWEIFVNYYGLRNAMQDRPELFEDFQDFLDGNTYNGITGCTIEYNQNMKNNNYIDKYEINSEGFLVLKSDQNLVQYKRLSDNLEYPEKTIVDEIKKMYDRAAN